MKKQEFQSIGDQIAPLRVQLEGPQAARRAVLDQKRSREQVRAQLDQLIEQHRITELEVALNDLEAKEESLICESELTAEPVARRADARPEIILA